MPEKQTTKQLSGKEKGKLASFESEFERLGAIVEKLESGSTSLEEMLKLYEEGVGLAGDLSTMLTAAELRVEKLARVHEEMLAAGSAADDEEFEDIETYAGE